ncbi:conserved hypothetical protein [Perkinsus marinus ATCC 50983]|uniref:Uncharacterized protein n=1 Tax=Perkinsus marinus (strain ATCC 50983 / TXsc) TaxID=423536 RepID=C5KF82_PERM5|nr:conserved hypothetical protein [Perkinsus marinus ATCC 50983]EER16884.1 conserved hypothetical protein [Perkinsus marinus ATCC 50983]|eukprot:XP_002785088.1 conserved hypothetical protein [Perkinsus marinus ATCC 50983]
MAVGPIFGRAALLRRHGEMMLNAKGRSRVAGDGREKETEKELSLSIGSDCLLGSTWRSVLCDGVSRGLHEHGQTSTSHERRRGHGLFGLADGTLLLLGGRQLRGDTSDECDSRSTTSSSRNSLATGSFSSWESSSDVDDEEDGEIVLFSDVCRSEDGGRAWETVRSSSAWCPRDDHGVCGSPDGKILLVLGGWSVEGDPLDDVWLSTDGGRHFECQAEHAPWQPRADFACIFLPARNRVLVYGGYSGGYRAKGDLWMSDDLGRTWDDITSRLPVDVGNRWGARMIALGGDEVLLCLGYDPRAPSRSQISFISDDGGMSWRQETVIDRGRSADLGAMPLLVVSLVAGPHPSEVFESTPNEKDAQAQKHLIELLAAGLPQGEDFRNVFRIHVAEALIGTELVGGVD